MGWEDDRFIRGIREDGIVVGSKKDIEANIWLEPQCWSVISGFALNDNGVKAMDTVDRELNTKYGRKRFSCITFEGLGDLDGYCSAGVRDE